MCEDKTKIDRKQQKIVAINGYNFILLKYCKQKGGLKLIKVQIKECHAAKTFFFSKMGTRYTKSIDPE